MKFFEMCAIPKEPPPPLNTETKPTKKKKKKPEVLLAITQRIADDKQCKKRTRRQADRQTLSQPEEADKNKDTETGRGPQRKIHEKKIEKIKRNCE